MDSYTNEKYRKQVDELAEDIKDLKSEEFTAILKISGSLQMQPMESVDLGKYQDYDIFQYTQKEFKGSLIRIHGFDSSTGFASMKNVSEEKKSFDDVISYLLNSARINGGFDLYCDGYNNKVKNEKRIRCCMYQLYKCQKKKGGSNHLYCVDPLINAKKGNRPDGRKLQRRSKTKFNVDKAD
jgi:hypothetical protein